MKDLGEIPVNLQDVYLTPREIDVIKLLAEGKTAQQAAATLGISPFTAYVHISHAGIRLNANKYNLVYYAHKMGVVP